MVPCGGEEAALLYIRKKVFQYLCEERETSEEGREEDTKTRRGEEGREELQSDGVDGAADRVSNPRGKAARPLGRGKGGGEKPDAEERTNDRRMVGG